VTAVAVAILLGLVTNELSDVSPWVARKLVAWSARVRYGDTARAEIRAEELAALVNERPGKLFKLGTALRFAVSALALRIRRLVAGEAAPSDPLGDDMLAAFDGLEPSALVAQFLFPTERFRGEWRRHWVHPTKRVLVALTFATLGIWAARLRIAPEYVDAVVIGIVVVVALWIPYRVAHWYFGRFVITNKRLMATEGLVMRRVAMIPLLRVTDLRYVQTPLGRVLGYGAFQLESASRSNALRQIVDLPNPNELYLRLVEEMYEPEAVEARLVDEPSRGSTAGSSPGAVAARTADLPDDPLAAQIVALSRTVEALAAAVAALPRPRDPSEVA